MAGNIKIIEPTSKFVKVSRGIIRDNSVDTLTLGLYVKILVLGKDWELNIAGLGHILGISEKKVRASINRLEALGYIRRVACRDESNKVLKGWDYYVYYEPVAEELRTRAGYQTYPKMDNTENSVVENQTCQKSDKTENGEEIYKDLKEYKDLNKKEKDNKRDNTPRFDFLSELLNLGVDRQVALDWLEVRKAKKGVNTKTAFKDFCIEVAKTGLSVPEAVRFAVGHSWCGFNAEWYKNAIRKETTPVAPSYKREEKPTLEGMMQRYGMIPNNGSNYEPDEQ